MSTILYFLVSCGRRGSSSAELPTGPFASPALGVSRAPEQMTCTGWHPPVCPQTLLQKHLCRLATRSLCSMVLAVCHGMLGTGVFAEEIAPLLSRGKTQPRMHTQLGQNLFSDCQTLLLIQGLPYLSCALLLHACHPRYHKITELCHLPTRLGQGAHPEHERWLKQKGSWGFLGFSWVCSPCRRAGHSTAGQRPPSISFPSCMSVWLFSQEGPQLFCRLRAIFSAGIQQGQWPVANP